MQSLNILAVNVYAGSLREHYRYHLLVSERLNKVKWWLLKPLQVTSQYEYCCWISIIGKAHTVFKTKISM